MADLMLSGFMKMMSPRPIARNILAIGLIMGAVYFVKLSTHQTNWSI